VGRLSSAAVYGVGSMMVIVGLTSAFFTWLGFGGIAEANDDIRPSGLRIGVTLGFMGMAALGAALVLFVIARGIWGMLRRRKGQGRTEA
jgi:hypothetical protein